MPPECAFTTAQVGEAVLRGRARLRIHYVPRLPQAEDREVNNSGLVLGDVYFPVYSFQNFCTFYNQK